MQKGKTNGDTALLIQTGRTAKKLPFSGGQNSPYSEFMGNMLCTCTIFSNRCAARLVRVLALQNLLQPLQYGKLGREEEYRKISTSSFVASWVHGFVTSDPFRAIGVRCR
jgi:hypothetical protein